jgi:hypothetical protein
MMVRAASCILWVKSSISWRSAGVTSRTSGSAFDALEERKRESSLAIGEDISAPEKKIEASWTRFHCAYETLRWRRRQSRKPRLIKEIW